MRGIGVFCAYLAALFSLVVFVYLERGQPQRHCRYLVPVKTVPGVYACSEYPRPLVKP